MPKGEKGSKRWENLGTKGCSIIVALTKLSYHEIFLYSNFVKIIRVENIESASK